MTEEQSKLVIRILTSPLIQSLAALEPGDSDIVTRVKIDFQYDVGELEIISRS